MPEQSPQLSQDLLKMLEKGSSNDVTIVLEDGEVRANKDILVARCPYFATMFSNQNFLEGQNNIVKMMNVQKEPMERVLKFIFSDNMKELVAGNFQTTIKVLELLRLLLLDQACTKVEAWLMKVLDGGKMLVDRVLKSYAEEGRRTASIVSGLVLLQKLKFEDLFQKCLDLFCLHMELILNCERERIEFRNIPFDVMKKMLMNPVGNLSKKMNAFKIWFDYNKEQIDEQDKIDILEFQMNFVRETLEKECGQCKDCDCYNKSKDDDK